MKTLIENRFVLVGLVLVALAATFGVVRYLPQPAAAGRAAPAAVQRVPVVSAVLACPAAKPGHGTTVRTGVASAPGGSGRADIRPIGHRGDATPIATLTRSGAGWFKRSSHGPVPLVVHGHGAVAGGLAAGRMATATHHAAYLAATTCTEPGTDFWFVGPGAGAGHAGPQLYLTNTDDAAATVDVRMYSDAGPIDSLRVRGITVPPHGTVRRSLSHPARGTRLLALNVTTSAGRVAAAVRATPGKHQGADWLPAAAAPARRVVVPGVPRGGGHRDLLVAAPGDHDATVDLKAAASSGTFTPGGDTQVHVPAGAVSRLPLDGVLGGRDAALLLCSNVPVTAALAATTMYSGGTDVGYTAAARPVDGRAVSALGMGGKHYTTMVVLSAPRAAATVRLSAFTARGKRHTWTIKVGKGHSKQVRMPVHKDGYGMVAQVGGGPVYAAQVIERTVGGGRLITVTPFTAGAGTVAQYPARGTLGVLAPGS